MYSYVHIHTHNLLIGRTNEIIVYLLFCFSTRYLVSFHLFDKVTFVQSTIFSFLFFFFLFLRETNDHCLLVSLFIFGEISVVRAALDAGLDSIQFPETPS